MLYEVITLKLGGAGRHVQRITAGGAKSRLERKNAGPFGVWFHDVSPAGGRVR